MRHLFPAIAGLPLLLGIHVALANTPSGTGGGPLMTGIFVPAADASDASNSYVTGLDANGLQMLTLENHAKGMVLVNARAYMDGATRRWAGVFRAGNDGVHNPLSVDLDLATFTQLATKRHGEGLALVDIETYVDGGQRKWAGVWRTGSDANYFSVDMDFSELASTVKKRNAEKLVIVDFETYVEKGARKYVGVWRAGTDANYIDVGLDRAAFDALVDKRRKEGVALIDAEIWDEGGAKKWGGIWRAGSGASSYEPFVDDQALTSAVHARHKQGVALVGLTMCTSNCSTGCMNQEMMPSGSYDYQITATSTHCAGLPGTCPTPRPGATVTYWSLDDTDGGQRYLHLPILQRGDRFMTLPYSDTAVAPHSTWLYSPGSWHHAIDFSTSDRRSFDVEAAAPGKVVHMGWDAWSGNTMIVSHDVNGVVDAYRTIYMHLRNGPKNDCDKAWSQTIPTLSEPLLSQYTFFLEHSGCPKNGKRNPDPQFWGTDADKLDATLLGKTVTRGQMLAHSGESGPGGCGCTQVTYPAYRWDGKSPNTHLHLFTTHRDSSNGNFYFVDPYGIYSYKDGCYPASPGDPISTDCSRYPILWRDNPPKRP